MSAPDYASELGRLRAILRQYPSLLVAYSGGVDSAVVMTIAREELGDKALACIGRSPSLAQSELRGAMALADRVGFQCRVVDTFEHQDRRYAANQGDRCYFCKRHLFQTLRTIAEDEGWAAIADGVHADDFLDHVHGMRAARELDVQSPLRDAHLGKAAVREIAKRLGLPVWDKPATPCLASRVPVGTVVTVARLRQIEAAEQALNGLGFTNVRVRHHGELARVELSLADLAHSQECTAGVIEAIQATGYKHVIFDLRRDR